MKMLGLIFLFFLTFLNNELGKPSLNFNWEFRIDLDSDGLVDYVSLSTGRAALSSRNYKIERIPKFNPLWAVEKDNEVWIKNRGKALVFRGGKVILRDLSLFEQVWLRMYRIEPSRASILVFNLLLTLFSVFLSIERLYRFVYLLFSEGFSEIKKAFVMSIFSFSSVFLFIFLLLLTKKFIYVLWIWAFEALSAISLPLLRKMKFFSMVSGIFSIIFILLFLYFSYFGFWFPIL